VGGTVRVPSPCARGKCYAPNAFLSLRSVQHWCQRLSRRRFGYRAGSHCRTPRASLTLWLRSSTSSRLGRSNCTRDWLAVDENTQLQANLGDAAASSNCIRSVRSIRFVRFDSCSVTCLATCTLRVISSSHEMWTSAKSDLLLTNSYPLLTLVLVNIPFVYRVRRSTRRGGGRIRH